VAVDLKRLRREVESGKTGVVPAYAPSGTTVVPKPARTAQKWSAIGIGILAVLGALAYWFRPTLPPPRITGFTQITHDGWQKNSFGQTTPIVLTDGSRLYLQETVHGRFVVVQVSASGGDTVPVTTPFPNAALDNLSPDKSELVVGSFTGAEIDQPLFAVPTLGGSPRRLTEIRGEDATWMANGDLLVAQSGELTAVDRTGKSRPFLKFGDTTSSPYWLRWSPDHQLLRFTMASTARLILAEIAADGSGYRRLLEHWHSSDDTANGNWTPDGKLFVFQMVHNWGRADIWAVREKGDMFHKMASEPVQLTAGPLNFYSPQPSLDGKRLYVIGEQPKAELVRYDAKSNQFLPYLDGISSRTVNFSRDGQWVSYVSYPEGNLWRCRIDGSDKLQLTSTELAIGSAQWSPDGHQIAVTASEAGSTEQLYVVSADGGAVRSLKVGQYNAVNASWGRMELPLRSTTLLRRVSPPCARWI
jgi:dipeptidyl aminopeptidase/acylaminoacyl peptidase